MAPGFAERGSAQFFDPRIKHPPSRADVDETPCRWKLMPCENSSPVFLFNFPVNILSFSLQEEERTGNEKEGEEKVAQRQEGNWI